MIKKVTKDDYIIEYPDTTKYSQAEIDKMIDDSLEIIKRKEVNDIFEPISSFKSFKYMDKNRQGHEIVKAFEDLKDNRMHVIVRRGDDYVIGLGYSPEDGVWNQGRYGYSSLEEAEKALKESYNVKVFTKPQTEDAVQDEAYLVHEDGSKVEKGDEVTDFRGDKAIIIDWQLPKFEGKSGYVYVEETLQDGKKWEGRYYPEVYGLKWVGLPWQKEDVEDVKIEDVPVNAPEEKVNITYTEKLKGGKNALTYGMIEEAFKNRYKDEGKTFAAYLDVAIESLKDDIANAKYLVSGEMKSTRSLLLEDYIKIEHLAQKAGLDDKVAEMKPLVDELSDKLNLNYFKQPKFKKSEMKQASRELRNKHRFDSKIEKKLEPVFLCSKSDLTASYNDAKQGKLPQVFEGNLSKVEKDMEADYDRINQGRDHYLEDPRIVKLLPEIVSLYELATKYADDLGYREIATRFAYMLNTIKKGWGLE